MAMVQLQSYAFTTVENPLSDGGNFAQFTGTGAVRVPSSGICEPVTVNVGGAAVWVSPAVQQGDSWPADQYSEVTIHAQASVDLIIPMVRMSLSAQTGYQANVNGSSGVLQVFKTVAGTSTQIGTNVTGLTVAVNDVWRITATGTTITVTQNGTQRFTNTDSAIASGFPGFQLYDSTVITGAQISLWAAGGNQAATPTFSPASGSATQNIAITSATPGGTIFYTTDGTTPTHSSSSVGNGGLVTISSNSTIKAFASVSDFGDSVTATASFTFALTAVWNKLGTIIFPTTADMHGGVAFGGTSNGAAMYDNNPQLISPNADGKVFKLWFNGGVDLFYAEANNAGGPWTRQVAAVISNFGLPGIYKSGSTYYLYGASPPTGTVTAVKCYTSTDGITQSLANATALVVGGAGKWDHTSVQYLKPFYFDGTTYYGTYSGSLSTTVLSGIATSTDLTHWTNDATGRLGAVGAPGPVVVGNTFYVLTDVVVGGTAPTMGVMSTTDITTWANPPVQILGITQLNEGEGVPTAEGIGPFSVIEAAGQSYVFYTGAKDALGTSYRQMVAYSNRPLAQALLTTGAGLVGQAISTAQAATDNFTRANETPLSDGGAWSTPTSPYLQVNLASDKAVASSTGSACHALWTGPPSIGNDHYSEVTLGTNSASAVWVYGPQCREASANLYNVSFNKGGAWTLNAIYAGVTVEALQSGNFGSLPIGTVARLAVSGSTLMFFINGTLVTTAFDSTLATGKPSFEVYDGTTPASTGVTLWAGGSAVITPSFPGGGGGAVGWSPVDSRQAVKGFGPAANTGIVDAQGNVIYSAQDPPFTGNSQVSDNAAIPPKDCRVQGAPVDSRKNVPVNSRVAPPFGEFPEP